ncbi:MAG: hypothetical protein KA297_18025 [Kofleriaceae bacterium]|nr:hypothetical protein [Kofleriaceae bacterium]
MTGPRSRVLALAAAVLLAATGAAVAAPRVAIIGDDAAAVAATRKAAPRGVEVVADIPADTTLAPAELAASHNLNAVLVIEVDHGKRTSSGSATAYQGVDGAELGKARASGRRKAVAGKLAKAVWKRLGPAVRKARGPGSGSTPVATATAPEVVPPAPTWATARPGAAGGDATPAAAAATASSDATGDGVRAAAAPTGGRTAPRLLELAVAGRPFWRRLRYRDDIGDRLRPYDLAANAVGGHLVVRPGVPGLHVIVAGELAIGVNGSRTTDMTAYATRASELTAAVGYGLHVAGAWVSAEVGAGQQRFTVVDEMAGAAELVPDVRYRFARGALVGTVPLGPRMGLTLGAGWRYLVDTGELESAAWFPRMGGQGVDASAGVDYALTPWLSGFAKAELRRYFFAMHPEIGDTWIVGGAVDQYLGASLGLQVRAL